MSTKLIFYTPTTLDEAFIFTMGASVKKSNNPIGFFGTGLKYAIAVTLRLGGSITIQTNTTSYKFEKVSEKLRGEDIEMIYANKLCGDRYEHLRCPMTTDYGKTWEPWMVLRELWSNTMDEGGHVLEDGWEMKKLDVQEGDVRVIQDKEYTTITVEHPAIYDAWLTRDKYFINPARTPIYSDDTLDVYQGANSAIFYRGIAVCQNVRTAFTYNLKALNTTLREDRTYDEVYAKGLILHRMVKVQNRHILSTFFRAACESETTESRMHFTNYELYEVTSEYADEAIQQTRGNIATAPASLKETMYKYRKEREKDEFYKPVQLSKEDQQKHDACIALLEKIGYKSSQYKIYYTRDMPDNHMGAAFMDTKTIVLNQAVTLDHVNWQRQTCTTLIEEIQHLKYNANDYTQDMQDGYNESIYQIALTGKVQ